MNGFEKQAYSLIKDSNYSKLAEICEQVLDEKISVEALIYLGIANLLLENEDECQIAWTIGLSVADSENQLNNLLLDKLTSTAELVEENFRFRESWLLRVYIKNYNGSQIQNILPLLWSSLWIDTCDVLVIEELKQLLQENKEKDEEDSINSMLQSYIVKVINSGLISGLPIVEVSLPWIKKHWDLDWFVNEIKESITRAAFRNNNFDFAVELTRLSLMLYPRDSVLLGYLPRFCMQAKRFEEAIVSSQNFYDYSKEFGNTIIPLSIMLQAHLAAGAWQKIYQVAEEYKNSLEHTLAISFEDLSLSASKLIFIGTGHLAYLSDQPKANRKLQEIAGQCLTHHALKIKPASTQPRINQKDNSKRIKIGYIGHTFRVHSVSWLCRWLFKYHNRNDFDISIFLINTRASNDFFQQWFFDHVDHVFECTNDVVEIYKLIQQQDIELLVDLDCLTHDTTATVIALKPAPVQISWLGWDAPGLTSVDYYIADPYVLPEDAQEYYNEKIYRLPKTYIAVDGFECDVPSIRRSDLDIPGDSIIYLTAQSGMKRHPETLRLQLKILKQVSNSYLLIKGWSDQKSLHSVITQVASEEDIELSRIKYLPMVSNEFIHRANLKIADVVLDTYPYNGATTTLETLWMEIPLVTRVGNQFAARNSYTFLKNLGVEEGIAFNDEDYVMWGARLGQNAELREKVIYNLRTAKNTSLLWNGKQFTENMETAYKEMLNVYYEKGNF